MLMNKNFFLPYYKEISNEISVFEYIYTNKLPLMLKGPTGCGKSRFVEYMAARFKKQLIQVSCNEETSAIDLLGRYLIKGSETIWQDGPVSRAVRLNGILYLDEVSEAREDVIVVLHSLSDYRRELYIDKTGEVLKASDGFMLITSFNPGYQKGFKELKPSTRQRFVSLSFNYPIPEIEYEIVKEESCVESRVAKLLIAFASKVRAIQELELIETISTRLLVNAGKLISKGLDCKIACNIAIIQPLTDDKIIQKSLIDLMNLFF